MTNQTFVYAFGDSYGGYKYLELDHENKKYTVGNSRWHEGHHPNSIKIVVKRNKDFTNLRERVDYNSWGFVETFSRI